MLGGTVLSERFLDLLIGLASGLAFLLVALPLLAVWFHLRHRRRARHKASLEARWEPAILDMLADPTVLSASLLEVDPDDELLFLQYLTRLARRLRGSEHETLARLARPFLGAASRLCDSLDPGTRAEGIRLLSTLGIPEYSPRVLAGLDDPSPFVTMTAVQALSRPQHAEYASQVLSRLSRLHDWRTRNLAALLSGMGPAVGPTMRGILADRIRPLPIRNLAAAVLAALLDPLAADVAVSVLAEPPERDLAAWCLALLGNVGGPQHLPTVREHLASADPALRVRAADALGQLAVAEDIPRLEAGLDDPSPWVALAAARGLRRAGAMALLSRTADGTGQAAMAAREALAGAGA